MPSGGRVLIITLSKGNLLETLPLARMLRDDGRCAPLYFVDPKYADILQPVLAGEGLEAIGPSGAPFIPAQESAGRGGELAGPSLQGSFSAKERLFRILPQTVRYFLQFRSRLKRARALLDRYPEIRALLLVGDRHIGFETAFIRAANERGVRSLIVPFAASFPEAVAEPRLRDKNFGKTYAVSTPWRALLALLFPLWVWQYKGRRMFFRSPSECVAALLLGMMPRKPWTLGGGFADRMTVDSENSLRMFLEQGMPREKMVVLGRPSMDEVAKTLQKTDPSVIRRELGVPEGKKIILCSVPQLAEHDLLPWDRHWVEMDFLFTTMAALDAAVVLSLHPKSDRARYQPHADAAGAVIAARRIYELLPACDVFVATYSSIVAPAIALGKPSIVVDFYGLEYPVYDGAPGVAVLRDRADFAPTLARLLTDKEFYEGQRMQQKELGGRWAILDGQCARRNVDELYRLLDSPRR